MNKGDKFFIEAEVRAGFGGPVALMPETVRRWRSDFETLERFATIVTGKQHPCALDLLRWLGENRRGAVDFKVYEFFHGYSGTEVRP
jgi:hypothetical protein